MSEVDCDRLIQLLISRVFFLILSHLLLLLMVNFCAVCTCFFPKQVQHLLQHQRQKGSGPTGPMGWHGLFFLPHNRLADTVMDRREISWQKKNRWKPDCTANAQVKEGSDPATFIELMKSGPSGWQGPRGPRGSQRVPGSHDVPGVAIFGPFSMAGFKWKSTGNSGNYGFANQRWGVSSISFPSSPELNLGCSVNTRDSQYSIGLVSQELFLS